MQHSRLLTSLGFVLATTVAFPHTADARCSLLECGVNSPFLAAFDFHDVDLSGARANSAGLRVLGLIANGETYRPRVDGNILIATSESGATIKGQALRGSYFLFLVEATGVTYRLYIDAVFQNNPADPTEDFTIWVDAAGEYLESYKLAWSEDRKGPVEHIQVCSQPPPTSLNDGLEWYPDPEGTIFFTGDRYDAKSKTVVSIDPKLTEDWVNVACAGGALYKLFMTRHTTASSNTTHTASIEERQAMLKMYVSDVCGDGQTFTEQGTPLRWTNERNWGYVTWREYGTEAYWGPNGALCLDDHRLGKLFTGAIFDSCHPSRCADKYPDAGQFRWPGDARLVSRLPVDPY